MRRKCVVVHAGARDHYELALALNQKDYLDTLITEVYCPDQLTKLFYRLAEKRYKEGLPSRKVSISVGALWVQAKMYLRGNFTLNKQKDRKLGMKAFNVAKNRESHLFFYSYYASHAFSTSEAFSGQKRLLFQLHPHPLSVRRLLEEELERVPAARASILYENELQYTGSFLEELGSESARADKIVVASSYTRQTLIENNVNGNKITVIPYGIDSKIFTARKAAPKNKSLRVIFIGSMIQRKGLSYLLDAINQLRSKQIELVLCGRGFVDEGLINSYLNIAVTVIRNPSIEQLVQALHNSDIFVLPTLSEGFAHVILEAMSAGLPVITTCNSCGPDIISQGKEGWIVPIRSSTSLAERLDWCINSKNVLYEMGQAAAATAALYTWEKFRKGIINFYESAIPDL